MTRFGRRRLPIVVPLLLAAMGCGAAAAPRPVAAVGSPVATGTASPTASGPAAHSAPARPAPASATPTAVSRSTAAAAPAAPGTGGCPGTLPAEGRCVADGHGGVAVVRLLGRYAVAPVAGDLPPTRGRTYTEFAVELVGVTGGFYYAPARFTVTAADGTVYRGCLPPKTHPGGAPLASGSLQPGQRVRGSVDFDVADAATLRLDDGTGTAVATWNLGG